MVIFSYKASIIDEVIDGCFFEVLPINLVNTFIRSMLLRHAFNTGSENQRTRKPGKFLNNLIRSL